MNPSTIRCLTGMRFIAALMVFCSHLQPMLEQSHVYFPDVINLFFTEGYVGVTFFFILSGFILTYNYQQIIFAKKITIKKFLLLRAAKIYPTHLLTFIIAVFLLFIPNFFQHPNIHFPLQLNTILPIHNLGIGAHISEKLIYFKVYMIIQTIIALLNLFLLQSFIPLMSIYFAFNGPSWSISDEAFFYGMFCLLLRIKHATLFQYAALLFVALLTLVIASYYYHFFTQWNQWLFYINPLARIFDFILGILLGKTFLHFQYKAKNHDFYFTIFEISTVCLLAIVYYITIHFNFIKLLRYDILYAFPMGFIIFIFAFEKGLISKSLKGPIWIFLGEISFAFYMFHQLIIRLFEILAKQYSFNIGHYSWGIVLLILLTSIIISSLSFLYYEKPLHKFLKIRIKSSSV